jgi:cell division protein FtsB
VSLRRLLASVLGSTVLVVFLVVGVLPTRTYLQQRDAMAAEEEKVQILTRENQKLASRVEQLHTDAEIERLAREQYNLVRPGEDAYAILPGPADPEPDPASIVPPVTVRADEPSWWTRAVDTLTFWD